MYELEILAAQLSKLPFDPEARMGYDWFAGGLVWSDEKPVFKGAVGEDGIPTLVGLGLFRALLNYRSSLILGNPKDRFRDLWKKALTLCPNWPGFLPQRRDPVLAEKYKTMSEASRRSWEELDARYEQQQNAQANTTKV